VDYLLTKINRELHKRVIGISDEMMDLFMTYRWPGNVRELENLLTRAVVVTKSQVLTRNDFPDLSEEVVAADDGKGKDAVEINAGGLLTLEAVEEQYIRKVIKENSHRTKGELCEILGISRPTFERKLEKYGLAIERD